MIPILLFFVGHWYLSAFSQSFFLHRYCSHGMFRMSRFWERFFFLFTFFAQGSSFLNPRAYAIMHREHHAHSDTERDPHSPHFFREVVSMMWHTMQIYKDLLHHRRPFPQRYLATIPTWPAVERIGDCLLVRLAFCALYTLFYIRFAPSAWWFALLPVHFLMGPVHGAFVNWCGHKYGYRNYKLGDHSMNTFFMDVLFMGECFQNNHHRHPTRPNFAVRWFEFDITFPVIALLRRVGVVQLRPVAAVD